MNIRQPKSSKLTPLCTTSTRWVRFEEVDSMQVMWHGRYASWLEDGREVLGSQYNMHYLDFYQHGIIIPVKIFYLDYMTPLLYKQEYKIMTYLIYSEAARLDFEYKIYNNAGILMTKGFTTQLMMDLEHNLILEPPKFYKEFLHNWQRGEYAH